MTDLNERRRPLVHTRGPRLPLLVVVPLELHHVGLALLEVVLREGGGVSGPTAAQARAASRARKCSSHVNASEGLSLLSESRMSNTSVRASVAWAYKMPRWCQFWTVLAVTSMTFFSEEGTEVSWGGAAPAR